MAGKRKRTYSARLAESGGPINLRAVGEAVARSIRDRGFGGGDRDERIR